MNRTNMNTKQDTTIEVTTTVQDTSVVEATIQKEIEDMQDSIDGYRQVTFNPDELQQIIQEQRRARLAGVPVSKYTIVVKG